MNQFHVPAVANVQGFTVAQFAENPGIININNTQPLNNKNYLLITFTDAAPIIYMIDRTNFYVAGFMWQDAAGFSFVCCDGNEVISHIFNRRVSFYNIYNCSQMLAAINMAWHTQIHRVNFCLDTIAFTVSESIRFNTIHSFLKDRYLYPRKGAVNCNDIKILTNSWQRVWGTNRIHITKNETIEWLVHQPEYVLNMRTNPFFIFLEHGY